MSEDIITKILDRNNLNLAFKNVKANKGASGIDDMSIEETAQFIREHKNQIVWQLYNRKYQPQPVRRVEIPKPNGGVRKLGIPTVLDRVIQQAMVQVLSPMFEPYFSEYSYGFRPNRCCQMAIIKALEYFNDGYDWIVDIDLEKFFDNVPHDRLLRMVSDVVKDGNVVSLVNKFLKAAFPTAAPGTCTAVKSRPRNRFWSRFSPTGFCPTTWTASSFFRSSAGSRRRIRPSMCSGRRPPQKFTSKSWGRCCLRSCRGSFSSASRRKSPSMPAISCTERPSRTRWRASGILSRFGITRKYICCWSRCPAEAA